MENSVSRHSRKLVAVMFTDIVGYSRQMSADERRALALLDIHDQILTKVIADHTGHLIKHMGDAVFAEFDAALKAVCCGIEIQKTLAEHNGKSTQENQICIRIGIHLGDVVVRNGDLFGEGINVAARLEPLAKPGGICISDAVYQSIKRQTDAEPLLVGEVELKNIGERHVIYEFPPFYQAPQIEPGKRNQSILTKANGIESVLLRTDLLPSQDWFRHFGVTLAGLLLSVVGGFTIGYSLGPTKAYSLTMDDIVAPQLVAQDLSQSDIGEKRGIWRTFSAGGRKEIGRLLSEPPSDETNIAIARVLRTELNHAIEGDRPLNTSSSPNTSALEESNRRAIEDMHPDGIAVLSGKRDAFQLIYANFLTQSSRWSTQFFLTCLLLGGVFSVGLAWLTRPQAVRFVFDDVRTVDDLIDYLVASMGFKNVARGKGSLVFRATLLTLLTWNVWSIRARIDGNSVVVHGPANFLKRLNSTLVKMSCKSSSSS